MEIVAKAGKMPVNLLELFVFFYAKLFSWVRVGKLCSKDEGRETVFRWADFSSGGSRTVRTPELL